MKTTEIVAVARMLDEAGYDGVICSDHLVYPRELSSPYPDSPTGRPGWPPETAWPDSWVLTAGRCRALPRTDRAFPRNHHRQGALKTHTGFVADSSDDAIRELIECLYGSMDKQDTSTFEALVSPRVVVEVGSAAPIGLDDWRAHLKAFYLGFPDGHHQIEEVLVAGSHGISRCRFTGTHSGEFQGRPPTGKKVSVGVIHIDRFQGDTVVAHRSQIDMHGLLAQLDAD